MSNIWQQRADEILGDKSKAYIAATLYWLVQSAMNSPINRKRVRPEEQLWIEAEMVTRGFRGEGA